jgi:tetratricopeptide (TPR) repeat protein
VQKLTGDYSRAAASQHRALALFRELGDRLGQAWAHNSLGVVQQLTSDYPAAASSHQHALEIFRDIGHRHGEAEALNQLGDLAHRRRDGRRARDNHTLALAIARQIGAPLEEARALEGMGHGNLQDGNRDEGSAYLRLALTIYQPSAPWTRCASRKHSLPTRIGR